MRTYTNNNLDRISFPLGGIGAGMLCLQGNGSFSDFSLRHSPEIYNQPLMFSALKIKQGATKKAYILQGKTPEWKVMFPYEKFTGGQFQGSGDGARNLPFGFPYFRECSFSMEFPFAKVSLADKDIPLKAQLNAWSPFIPGDSKNSSLPVTALEYTFINESDDAIESVFYHASDNFMKMESVKTACCSTNNCQPQPPSHKSISLDNGFIHYQPGENEMLHREGSFSVHTDEEAKVNCCWFRGGWFDSVSSLWREIENGSTPKRETVTDNAGPSKGASLAIPFDLKPGESKTIRLYLCWYVPFSDKGAGLPAERKGERYKPWYATEFKNIDSIISYWQDNYHDLYTKTRKFTDSLYSSTIPAEVIESVAANLTILKTPTILRQDDGRIWCWEGCCDCAGCCHGSCTHVWNYAQALPHLFPDLERSLRQTEFNASQDENGHQNFRSSLPIGEVGHGNHAAADGQLGGIMKIYREWKISGDKNWLRDIWPKVEQSLDYCIRTWDPDHTGTLLEPHHNTYDIEFWGADGMCTSFYLGALKAAGLIAEELNLEPTFYTNLCQKGRKAMETELFNGEYFIQKVQWNGLHAQSPLETNALVGTNIYNSPEAQELLIKEGPKYQYGNGCLSDGVLGQWMAEVCGIGEILDQEKVKSHLNSIYKYNFRKSLHTHANPQRPGYALNEESGLLLCSWPHGDKPTLPFVYSDEVWTGIEYQVAAHLIMLGETDKGLNIVRAIRNRYDGYTRNPFNEYECGHWYARAMSSYSLLQAYSGISYDAITKTLTLNQQFEDDFNSFICTETGFGKAGIHNNEPFVDVVYGNIEVNNILIK